MDALNLPAVVISFIVGFLSAGILSRVLFGSWLAGFHHLYDLLSWQTFSPPLPNEIREDSEQHSTVSRILYSAGVVVLTILSYTSADYFIGR